MSVRRWWQQCVAGVLGCALVSGVAAKGSDAPEQLTRVPHYAVTYTLNADGTFVEQRAWSMTVLKEKALADAKEASITYSTSIQKAEVLEAYTLKADGRHVPVPPSNFQVQVNGGKDADAPAFSDQSTLTAVFPELAVGDTVVFAYRLTATAPLFPKHFSTVEHFSTDYAYDDVRIRIDAPATLWTQYKATAFKEVRNEAVEGRKIIEWAWENKQPVRNKRRDYSVIDPEAAPGVAFSTFRSYGEIAQAYGERARPKAAVTEPIRALASEIAGKTTAPREVAKALYEWVAVHISYAGNCIGLGAVVPHDLDFVLQNHMGDCKDHATLLQALLAAKGIASTQALINAGSEFRLASIPVVSRVNHVINYLPESDLYLDSTSDSTPFGMLPSADQDKPVLWVDGYKEGTRTPPPSAAGNVQHMKTVVQVGADGSFTGRVEVALKGEFAVYARNHFRDMPKEREEEFVKNVFRAGGRIGEGELVKEDPKGLLDTYSYHSTFKVRDFVVIPGPGAFSVAPLFYNIAPVSRFMVNPASELDETDTTCHGGHTVEEYEYHFPPQITVLGVPESVRLSNATLSYAASYVLKGRVLRVRRAFDDLTQGAVCSPATSKAYRDFVLKVLPNLRAQVVYKTALNQTPTRVGKGH